MSGTNLHLFNDWLSGTGPAEISSPDQFVNEAAKRTYYIGKMIGGEYNDKKYLGGGESINERGIFDDNGTFQFYNPQQTYQYQSPQLVHQMTAHWRFAISYMTWNKQEIQLNQRVKYSKGDALWQAFLDIKNVKEAAMWTSKWNGMEDALWATPEASFMEGTGDTNPEAMVPYSIPAFVNEFTNGLFGNGNSGADAFTQLEGIDPTKASVGGKFQCAQGTYGSKAITSEDNIFSAFDDMLMDLQFETPEYTKQYFEDPSLAKYMILTSKEGRKAYQHMLRQSNDGLIMGGKQDPAYPDPQYLGIPIKRNENLETAQLYSNTGATSLVGESAADNVGPRFYWINGHHTYPVFHDEVFCEWQEITKHHFQPDTWARPMMTWYNMFCTSPRRNGIVSPSTDLFYGN